MTVTEQAAHPHSIRLARTYDGDRLAHELGEVAGHDRLRQPGPYHDGEWTGISLYSLGGKQNARASTAGLEGYKPCEVLGRLPYFRTILDELACPKQVVRLLWLPPGGKIGAHRDSMIGFTAGHLRLHVPIVTHPKVAFLLGGERVRWSEGELWYGAFQETHSVVNESDINRVHMVIDVEINESLLGLFPPAFVDAQRAKGITLAVPPVDLPAEALSHFLCTFTLPGEAMAVLGLGSSMREMLKGRPAEVTLSDKDLIVLTDGLPTFGILPIGPRKARICGMSSGATLHFPEGEGDVDLELRGYPTDLFAARIGGDAGPERPRQRIVLPRR
jgi:hypothetical protein